jgi:hypothetical protein
MAHKGPLADMPPKGRRWVVVGLQLLGEATAYVHDATGYAAREQRTWMQRFLQTGDVKPLDTQGQRTDRTAAIEEAKRVLKELIDAENEDARSSKRLAAHVAQGPRQVRRILHEPGISSGFHRLDPVPRLTRVHIEARLRFAAEMERQAWKKVAFTDSKVFVGEMTAKGASKIYVWHPDGRRRQAPTKKNAYQIHVYGAVTAFGGIQLVRVTGTTGQASHYVYTTGARRGQQHRGVCAAEYIAVLNELLPRLNALFLANGIEDWVFQQDGAKIHKTPAVLDHIRANTPNFIEHWPAQSPDLSWIENVWSIVEHKLWEEKEWNNFIEFENKLCETWGQVTGDVELMARMSRGMAKRLRELVAKGGHKIDY